MFLKKYSNSALQEKQATFYIVQYKGIFFSLEKALRSRLLTNPNVFDLKSDPNPPRKSDLKSDQNPKNLVDLKSKSDPIRYNIFPASMFVNPTV